MRVTEKGEELRWDRLERGQSAGKNSPHWSTLRGVIDWIYDNPSWFRLEDHIRARTNWLGTSESRIFFEGYETEADIQKDVHEFRRAGLWLLKHGYITEDSASRVVKGTEHPTWGVGGAGHFDGTLWIPHRD